MKILNRVFLKLEPVLRVLLKSELVLSLHEHACPLVEGTTWHGHGNKGCEM
jgi:hypothetical protein